MTTENARPTFEDGEWVNLRARVYRSGVEQALIEFRSMEGVFSIRVPVSELSTIRPAAPSEGSES